MFRWAIAIGLITMVGGIGGVGYGVWSIWNQHHVITSARSVTAKVVDHQTKDLKASGFVAKVPLVKYEYTVNQQPYICETVTPERANERTEYNWTNCGHNQELLQVKLDIRHDTSPGQLDVQIPHL